MTAILENNFIPKYSRVSEYSPITKYNQEIQKTIILLNKLLTVLKEKTISPESFSMIASKYSGRLESKIKLRDVYIEMINGESKVVNKEFKDVSEDKELLMTRKNIKEIGEEEFMIKTNALDWDLDYLNNRKKQLSEGLKLINSIKNMLNPSDVSEIVHFIEDEVDQSNDFELNDKHRELYLQLKKIVDIIS